MNTNFIERAHDFYIDFKGTLEDENVREAIGDLSKMSKHLTVCGTPEVPWFPTHIADLETMGKKTLSEGEGIQMTDHPGFHDEVYKERRNYITQLALDYHLYDKEIPRVDYTKEEKDVWTYCFTRLKKLFVEGACTPFNESLELMEKNCGFSETNIPQLDDISTYITSQTGWRLRPVGGLLS
jgi:phenylalanine-4-hydroxylase